MENDALEEKDLAQNEKIKENFEKMVIDIINNMDTEKMTQSLYAKLASVNLEIEKVDEEYKISIFGQDIATINKDKNFSYNIDNLQAIKKELGDSNIDIYEELGLPDIENLKDLEKEKIKSKEEDSIKDKEQKDDEDKDDKEEQNTEEEKDDNEREDDEIEQIASIYGISSKNIVHIDTKRKKITEDQTIGDLVEWAKGKDDVYIISDEKGKLKQVLEKKDGHYEEIDTGMKQIDGNYPDATIHLVKDNKIVNVKPLKIYEINEKQAIATIRNEWNELETIYCRRQEGEKEFMGEIIPEMCNKNTKQMGYNERSFMDSKNNSNLDLSKKADEIEKYQNHDLRGVPSSKKGVQVEEINGNIAQNEELEKENIKKDLYERMGLKDDMKNLMPGQSEYIENKIDKQAEKIQNLLHEDDEIAYEEAVKKVQSEERDERWNDARR